MTKCHVGENLFSIWRELKPAEWELGENKLTAYTEVEPVYDEADTAHQRAVVVQTWRPDAYDNEPNKALRPLDELGEELRHVQSKIRAYEALFRRQFKFNELRQ